MKAWLVRLVLLGTLGAVAFLAWGCFFPNPERVIRNKLVGLAQVASIAPHEGQLTKLANIQKLSSFFSADAEITVDVPGRSVQTIRTRDELLQAAGAARSMLNTLKVEFVDIIV